MPYTERGFIGGESGMGRRLVQNGYCVSKVTVLIEVKAFNKNQMTTGVRSSAWNPDSWLEILDLGVISMDGT